jgi:hypothetical protein
MAIFNSYVSLPEGRSADSFWSNIIQHNEAQTWQLEISKSFFLVISMKKIEKTHAGGQKRA